MKFTLNECVQRINQILNYPAVSYADISHFFDHAISELNTILRIGLPTVSEMVNDNTIDVTMQENTVMLTARPTNTTSITVFQDIPNAKPTEGAPTFGIYYPNKIVEDGEVVSVSVIGAKYYTWTGLSWTSHDSLYGVTFEGATQTAYIATTVGGSAFWVETPARHTLEIDLCEYLPLDWWMLFMIPYVCFKFAVRNGDDGALYSTEFSEGLQQLQTCYDVPNFVTLNTVAGNPIYTKIVQNNLNNLGVTVPTRAITEDMRIGNAVRPIYGNLYDVGGWGI